MQITENKDNMFRKKWVHILAIFFMCGLLTFFFVKNKYTDYPFYQRADCDALYSSLSVVLINNGNLTCTAHPGATVLSLYGGIYRALSLVSQDYRNLFNISHMKTRRDASETLIAAIVTGRVIALITVLMFSIVYYLTLVYLTENWLIAFIFAFIVVTSPAVLYHIAIIRPECLSITFFFLSVLFFLSAIKVKRNSALRCGLSFFACGFSAGMAVLSKIQIGPLIAMLAVVIILSVFFHSDLLRFQNVNKSKLLINITITVICIIIIPWWSLRKPSFLSKELLSHMSYDFQRLYGNLPETFFGEVFIACLVLFGIATGILFFRKRLPRIYIKKLYYLSLIMNLFATGTVVSVYIILLPVSVSFNKYVTNTNHLVYSVFTNINGAGFLENSGAPFYNYVKNILLMHSSQSSLAKINLIYIVAIASIFCIAKFCFTKVKSKLAYWVPITIFASAFVMDLFSCMRGNHYAARYAIYSTGVYVMGLAYLAKIECAGAFQKPFKINWNLVKILFIIILFTLHIAIMPIKPHLWPSIPNKTEWCWSLVRYFAPEFPSEHVLLHKTKFVFSPKKHQGEFLTFFHDVGQPVGYWLFTKNVKGGIDSQEPFKPTANDGHVLILHPGDKIPVIKKAENMKLNDFTISLWINILRMPLSGGRGETLLFGSTDLSLGLTIVNGGLYDREIWGYCNRGSGQVRSGWAIKKNEWYHVVLTKKKERLNLYIDGKEVGRANVVSVGRGPKGVIGCNLGKKPASISATFMIASAAVWAKALSSNKIKKLYDLQK